MESSGGQSIGKSLVADKVQSTGQGNRALSSNGGPLSGNVRKLEKHLVKGYKAKYYKTLAGWRKAIKRCQDAEHKGWLYDVTSLFRSRVCKECKTQVILLHTLPRGRDEE